MSFLNRYSTVVCLLCVLSAVEICVQYSKQARNQETINSQFCQTVSYFAVLSPRTLHHRLAVRLLINCVRVRFEAGGGGGELSEIAD